MGIERELLKGNTPTLVLAVLRDGPQHGYAIARAIERRSEQALRCREGTLYPALHALEREGLIAGEWQPGPAGRSRRVYRLTPAGQAALDERAQAWDRFAAAVHRVLAGENQEGSDGAPERTAQRDRIRPTPGPQPA
jgi:PadR family transcriptional regulator